MSVLSISDMISSNLLSELDLNPAWEKWRGYFLAGSIVCSLIPFYMTLNGIELHCVPKQPGEDSDFLSETYETNVTPHRILCCDNITNPSSVNSDCEKVVPRKLYRKTLDAIERNNSLRNATMMSGETNYINARCATQENLFMLRFSGAIMLGIVVVIIFLSTFWLHIENVKDGIRRFADTIQSLPKVHLSSAEIKRLCSETSTESDDVALEPQRAVRGCITVLTSEESTHKIFTWYRIRCIILICVIFFLIVPFLYVTAVFGHWQNELTCRPTLNRRIYVSLFEEFLCTVNPGYAILVFNGIFSVTIILQALVFLLTVSKWKSVAGRQYYSRSVRLLVLFWNSSIPQNSSLFRDIACYIQKPQYKRELSNKMRQICQDEDYELIRVKRKLTGNAQEVPKHVYDIFTVYPTHSNLNIFIEAMKAGGFLPLTDDSLPKVKEVIKNMNQNDRVSNELFANILQTCEIRGTQDVVEIINLNRIEDITLDSEERRSILFYAFSPEHSYGPNRFAAAKALCQQTPISDLRIKKRSSNVPTNTERDITHTLEEFLYEIYEKHELVNFIIRECTLENEYMQPNAYETRL